MVRREESDEALSMVQALPESADAPNKKDQCEVGAAVVPYDTLPSREGAVPHTEHTPLRRLYPRHREDAGGSLKAQRPPPRLRAMRHAHSEGVVCEQKGNFAAFMVAAARRAKEEYLQMLNDNATIIQQNFRGHLWNLLNLAAVQHNRSRRISFAFRHYQYRVWVSKKVARRVHRPARRIQKFCRMQMWKALLTERFKLRKVTKVWFNLRRTLAANSIQREYRAHLEREDQARRVPQVGGRAEEERGEDGQQHQAYPAGVEEEAAREPFSTPCVLGVLADRAGRGAPAPPQRNHHSAAS